MNFLINVVLVSFVISLINCENNSSDSIERCKNEDKQCLINLWNKYIKMAGSMDIPQLNLPNLSKYFIDKMKVTTGDDGPLNIKVEFRNSTLMGLEKFHIEKIVGFPRDPKSMNKFVIQGQCPDAHWLGKYKASGKILLIPIAGDGDADIHFFNIKFKITADTKTEMVDGKEYLVIPKVHVNYATEKNHYKLDNLLNNKELSDGVNRVINENQDVLNPELVQPLGEALADVFKGIFVPVFKKYPYRDFFLDA